MFVRGWFLENRLRKYERLKQSIITRIEDLTWRPGDRLPVESYFCEAFDVSRITVQKAKADLLSDGYLELLPGRKGHYIKKPPSSRVGTGLIGVTIDDISVPFAASILKGIEDRLRDDEFHTIICSGNYDPKSVKTFVSSVQRRGVDGMIFTPIMGEDYAQKNLDLLQDVGDQNLPLVFVDRFIPGESYNSVASNNYQAAYTITKKLIDMGKKKILFFGGVECSSVLERRRGYVRAHEDSGLKLNDDLSFTVDDLSYVSDPANRAGVRRQFETFMDTAASYDSCFCSNHTSFELLNGYLARYNSDYLKTLTVAVYDFQPTENLRFPFKLLSVVQQTYRVGWEAAALLIRAIQDPDHPTVQMTVKSKLHFDIH